MLSKLLSLQLNKMISNLSRYIPNQYVRAIILLVIFLLLIRLGVYVLQKFILKFVKKTKTELDDIILKKVSFPITAIVFLISFWISVQELTILDSVIKQIGLILHSLIVINIGCVFYIIIDLALFKSWRKFVSKTRTNLDDSLVYLVHSFLKVLLVVLAILYILNLWGIEIGPVLAGLGIAGLAVALALQPSLSNIFSGIAMILDKTIGIGDVVSLDPETSGSIEKIGLRSTKIRTFDNELIVVPNSKMADGIVKNITLPEPEARVVVPFSVEYGSDIKKVKEIIMREIKKVENFIENPEPVVRFLEMGSSSLNFKAFFYVNSFKNRYSALDEANTRIYNALNKAKINIPYPQLDVHLKKK